MTNVSIWQSITTRLILDFFKQFGIQHGIYDSISLLLTRYFNFRLKYIVNRQRNLRVSKEFSDKLLNHPNREACFDIFYKTSNGTDINPYQSKGLLNADVHDGLFNDWGIHHLHLGEGPDKVNPYFIARSDYLLLVKFTDEVAYFLDIYKHKEKNLWSLTDLIRIVQRNWPKLLAPHELGRKVYPELNDEEIGILRRKGYLFGINVDDKAYLMLGDSYTSSGDNMMAGRMADKVMRWAWANEEWSEQHPKEFEQGLKTQLGL